MNSNQNRGGLLVVPIRRGMNKMHNIYIPILNTNVHTAFVRNIVMKSMGEWE